MARDDDWDEGRRYDDYREVRRREEARARGYGDYGRPYDEEPRVGYRAAREDLWFESRQRDRDREDDGRRRSDHAFRPFGDNGPTAYGSPYYDRPYNYGAGAPTYAASAPYASTEGYGAVRSNPYARQRYQDGRFGLPPGERRADEGRSFLDKAADQVASWFGDQGAERRRREDEMHAGHRGRGPKGYKRSDGRIQEDINERLTEDPYLDATDIDVVVSEGDVVLTGMVMSREDKRRAERLAEDVSGVGDVQNNLRLRRPTGVPDEAIERPPGSAM